jgi:hypothetical protein
LRETAIADLRAITESDADFGWPITVTNPAGEQMELHGLSADIGLTIDPETGIAVVGRKASVAIARGSLEDIGMPAGVASSSGGTPSASIGHRRRRRLTHSIPK